MAHCKQSAQDFLQSSFCPQVAVLCSYDAELLCQKNNLTFVELTRPFSRLTVEAHVRDPNGITHAVHNLRLNLIDVKTATAPQQQLSKKALNEAVLSALPQNLDVLTRGNVLTIGDYDLRLSSSTPWFEAYRDTYMTVMQPSDHEFVNHCLACLFIVSSSHSDPLAAFHTLSSQQQQRQQQAPTKLPKWFCTNTLKYYVLLHDVLDGEQNKAEAVYETMKGAFGSHVCHMLQINSRSSQIAETLSKDNTNIPDPWCQFMQKPNALNVYIGAENPQTDLLDDDAFPDQLVEFHDDGETSILTDSMIEEATEVTAAELSPSTPQEVTDHPLAIANVRTSSSDDYHAPLTVEPPSMGSNGTLPSGLALSNDIKAVKTMGHGLCLNAGDQDRIRIFVHEFAVRALIPWAERQMRMLNEQLMSRKGLHRSIFSVKKWLGGNKPANQLAAQQNTTVVYTIEAPELQMRRLADLAFLFQMYEFAYQTYHTAKRDFNNDHAWLHYAGALEMACLSIFLLGPFTQRQYPPHYMDSAITTYLNSCRNPQYAARCTLLSSECLKAKKLYSEAAKQFIKMTSEDTELGSALMLEQAAHCFIHLKPPMVRKYSFNMILAGHRYNKSAQKRHALRSYSQALQIYKGKGWTLAEDHINFTIGRQWFNLKHLDNAVAALKHLLTEESHQSTSQQSAFLREYLFVYKQLLMQNTNAGADLPELPLPLVHSNRTSVRLCDRVTTNTLDSDSDTDEEVNDQWSGMEQRLVSAAKVSGRAAAAAAVPLYRLTRQYFSQLTDNSNNPVAFVGEIITVELDMVNPMQTTLVLTDVSLLWRFVATSSVTGKSQAISNEVQTVKNNVSDDIIHTDVLKEIVLSGQQHLKVPLTMTAQQTGELRIIGFVYSLATTSAISLPNHKPTFTSSVYVHGKQRLEVQGPRLNGTKQEKVSKVYGSDLRLDLIIQDSMPLLQANFSDFPNSLLCGEVCRVRLQLTNIGQCPLQKIKLTCSNPEVFAFASSLGDNSSVNKVISNNVYCTCITNDETRTLQCNSSNFSSVNTDKHADYVKDIELSGDRLQSRTTIAVWLWVRAPSQEGTHKINFLFYYEPVNKQSKVKYRVLRYTVAMTTCEPLHIRALGQRANASNSASTDLTSLILSCELENRLQNSPAQDVCIQQVSCASEDWVIRPLETLSKTDTKIGSRETLQFCLKASRRKPVEQDKLPQARNILFSNVSLGDSTQIDSAQDPCRCFYFLSHSCNKSNGDDASWHSQCASSSSVTSHITNSASLLRENMLADLQSASNINLTLIILWKISLLDSDGVERVAVGQHHITMNKLNNPVTSYSVSKASPELPPVKIIRDEVSAVEPCLSTDVTSQLAHYVFTHASHVCHNFHKTRLCILPVQLTVQNCSNRPLNVLIDTSKAKDSRLQTESSASSPRSSSPVMLYTQPHATHFSWLSQTLIELCLDARTSHQVSLQVCCSHPGVYNVNQLSVCVSYKDNRSEMLLQKHTAPSVIIIENDPPIGS